MARDPEDNLSGFSFEEIQDEFSINTFSPLFAAQEAVKGFKQLPQSASRTFIFTGNALNDLVIPAVLTFGMAKSATARMVTFASAAYEKQGFKYVLPFLEVRHLTKPITDNPVGSILLMSVKQMADQQFLSMGLLLVELTLSLHMINNKDRQSIPSWTGKAM